MGRIAMPQTTVHILMATYNGGRFLRQQLASIAEQTHTAWRLTVSDDGSSDETRQILHEFALNSAQTVTLVEGPRLGATRNFMRLIGQADAQAPDTVFAFADQDDVWLQDKLARAVRWHNEHQGHAVRLYCGRTRYVDAALAVLGESRRLQRAPSFGNALVQNIASGNTMVLSPQLVLALQKIQAEHSVWHDWTTYLTATALEGCVFFDDTPTVLYRQHEANTIGANDDWRARLQRLAPVLRGRYKTWSDTNWAAMQDLGALLPPSSQKQLLLFSQMRDGANRLGRLSAFRRSAIRRQSMPSNVLLLLALIFGLF